MKKTIKPLPRRAPLAFKYVDEKDRRMVSIRLPEALIHKLRGLSKQTGLNFTELVQYALDQYCQIQK
jgi:predicted DNA binding CopG/RHH family protein